MLKTLQFNHRKAQVMNEYANLQECRGYVSALLQAQDHPNSEHKLKHAPAITISRQTGARGRTIGTKLQTRLRQANPDAVVPWTLFDKDLVKKVLSDHNLPQELEKFMPDDGINEIESSINEILGRHPSLWSLFENMVETIVRLCRIGNCIIVGRGANKVTQGFTNTLNVRFVGSTNRRIHQMVTKQGLSPKDATQLIKNEDLARARYMKQHFSCEIEDPQFYDLILNTDHLDDEAAVDILTCALKTKE